MFHVNLTVQNCQVGPSPNPENLKMLALPHCEFCGFLRIFAGVLQKIAGFLGVISNVFGGSFHFAQLNLQTLKNTLDIQLPFQKQGVVGVSRVSDV